jgi:hypothetical protein
MPLALGALVLFVDTFLEIGFGAREPARTFLVVCALVALRARAFPAGERLVAGFRRVDLPTVTRLRDDDDTDEWRAPDFFKLFAIELLISESGSLVKPAENHVKRA